MNRLQEDFGEDVAFEYLDAVDGAVGQAAFAELGLRGHPTVLIFDAAGNEIYRSFGIIEEDALSVALADL